MRPAYESFEAGQEPGVGVYHRLVVEMELVIAQRLAQRLFEQAALFGRDVQLRFVAGELAATGVLGAIERQIGGADQHFRGPPVAWSGRQADAGPGVERMVVDFIRARQRVHDCLGKVFEA
ncbi:hypothetical protein D9M73_189960 [compost metagenome]